MADAMIGSFDGYVQEESPVTSINSRKEFSAAVADAVRRHLDGDRTAMTEIVRQVSPWLYRIARGYRLAPYAAEDVVQNTLLALYQQVGRLRDPQTATAWLSVVARHEALRVIRADARAILVGESRQLDGCSELGEPERALLLELVRGAVIRNLAKLPPRTRDLLRLAFLAEVRDYATLSELLDMPVGSIGPTRRRGLEKMRNLLEADDDWRLVETA
jgi:RNA polymerase sigma factor (sigma-70 family)